MKTSETLNKLKNVLSESEYVDHISTINQLTILPDGLTVEELYSETYGGELFYYTLRVERRNRYGFAVVNYRGQVYSLKDTEGKPFQYENIPSERSDEFLRNTRFPLEEAVRIAEAAVEDLTLMGRNLEEMKQLYKEESK